MDVDGRVVGRALVSEVKPVLKALGFDHFQGRHFWRRRELTIDLVTFPSLSSYIAERVGCTTFSFGAEAGVYYPALEDYPMIEWPRGYHLTFRAILSKYVRQPIFRPWGTLFEGSEAWRRDRADTWYVLEDGSNLDEVVVDALRAVREQAIPYIDQHDDPERALQSLLAPARSYTAAEEETLRHRANYGSLWTIGANPGSPGNLDHIQRLSKLLEARHSGAS